MVHDSYLTIFKGDALRMDRNVRRSISLFLVMMREIAQSAAENSELMRDALQRCRDQGEVFEANAQGFQRTRATTIVRVYSLECSWESGRLLVTK